MDFSFIIPVYNSKAYLKDCVNSILSANVSSCEIIFVDDGSFDGTSELCDTLAQEYTEIRVLHQKNRGVSAARNTGIQAAQGQWILFVDADDTLDSVELEQVLSDPRISENDLTIFGLSFDFYHGGKCYRRDPMYFETKGQLSCETLEKNFYTLYLRNSLSAVWNKVYKRSILLENHLKLNTNMFLYEDLEFVLRYLSCCKNIYNVPKVVYKYRQTEDEGNAKRRLSRVDSIPDFLIPIEAALDNLKKCHSGITTETVSLILHHLHLVLAWDKITVSGLWTIRKICREYTLWSKQYPIDNFFTKYHRSIAEERFLSLYLKSRLTTLRHFVAVRVKYIRHLLWEAKHGTDQF